MLIAVPVGIGIAIFLTEICPRSLRRPIGIAIELLAGIPEHHLRHLGPVRLRALVPAARAALADRYLRPTLRSCRTSSPARPTASASSPPSLILSIMILPFISAVTRDVFETVPPMLKEAAYGLGCTTWEVMWRVVLPFARAGVVGGAMLALGRALGETMAVTFVIGNAHHISRPRCSRRAPPSRRPSPTNSPRRWATSTCLADRTGPDPVLHHLHRAGARAAHAAGAGTPGGRRDRKSRSLSRGARSRNRLLLVAFGRRGRIRPGLAGADPGRRLLVQGLAGPQACTSSPR